MSISLEMLIAGALLLLSVLASKITAKLGIPVIIGFLGIGMFLGSDGPGGVWFTDAQLTQNVGVVALTFILFAGGMDLNWKESRPFVAHAVSLATIGTLITALIVGYSAAAILGITLFEGLLLGSIVASTDAAAVFASLGVHRSKVPTRMLSILEMESGSNDPIAIFLTITLISLINSQSLSITSQLLIFSWQMGCGLAAGWLVGRAGVIIMRKLKLNFEGLFHGLSLSVALIAFGGTEFLAGNGFLAVYVAGITFGNGQFAQQKGLRRFHDGLAWLMQILLFIVLGLLVFPSQLPATIASALGISAILIFIARPIAVHTIFIPFKIPFREQAFIAFAGLRGAVPIVLATFPLVSNLPRAQEFFHIVFFVVLTSTLIQSPIISYLAKHYRPSIESPTSE